MGKSIVSHPAYGAFKAYDVRGRVPQELTPELYYRIGTVYAQTLEAHEVAVGYDIRLSSPELAANLIAGLADQGVNVWELGLCGTEEVYFATGSLNLDGGLMITASHNPADYNGLKMVGAGARPLPTERLRAIRDIALSDGEIRAKTERGWVKKRDIHGEFIDYALSLVKVERLPKLKVVCNPGNGGAGVVIERLRERLPLDLVIINDETDGSFPHGVPNPLLPERREDTSRAVLEHHADLGLAWDGDFDRCFFFDEKGHFIEGYYLVGLLAQRFLSQYPNATIIHDPRLTWNTREIVTSRGGNPVQSSTGHAFVKQKMRDCQAIYGGEMSAHHYFRDFFFCDCGMLPWLFVVELLGTTGKPLSALVDDMIAKYPISGEINRRTTEGIEAILERIQREVSSRYGEPLGRDTLDGLSLEYAKFRFNVRTSNTEPLVRLNVETRADQALLKEVTALLLTAIGGE